MVLKSFFILCIYILHTHCNKIFKNNVHPLSSPNPNKIGTAPRRRDEKDIKKTCMSGVCHHVRIYPAAIIYSHYPNNISFIALNLTQRCVYDCLSLVIIIICVPVHLSFISFFLFGNSIECFSLGLFFFNCNLCELSTYTHVRCHVHSTLKRYPCNEHILWLEELSQRQD